jgi:hypothetical protein
MRLVALVGLAFGSAVFSGCTNGHSASTAGPQQNTPVKANARNQGGITNPEWVDWTKDPRSQKSPQSMGSGQPLGSNGMGAP